MDQKQPELVSTKLSKKPKALLIIGVVLLIVLIGIGGWQIWKRLGKTPEVFINYSERTIKRERIECTDSDGGRKIEKPGSILINRLNPYRRETWREKDTCTPDKKIS